MELSSSAQSGDVRYIITDAASGSGNAIMDDAAEAVTYFDIDGATFKLVDESQTTLTDSQDIGVEMTYEI